MKAWQRFADFVDWLNERVGRAVAWLTLTMALVTFAVATLRYGFDMGWVWLQETYVWMHGAIIMLAMAHTLSKNAHVRVDVFYRAASVRYQALADLLGTLFLLIPTVVVVSWYTVPYVLLSWQRFETSREAGGMPALFLFKTTMIFFCLLLFLQALALVVRSINTLATGAAASPDERDVTGV